MIESPQAGQCARNRIPTQFLFVQKTQIQSDIIQFHRQQIAGSTFLKKGFKFFQVKQIGLDGFVGIAPLDSQIFYENLLVVKVPNWHEKESKQKIETMTEFSKIFR